jgi:predicted protein tyrosine phosphatase
MNDRRRVLFVCSQGRMRSPTAATLYEGHPKIDAKYAGADRSALVVLTAEMLEWAELIVVFERTHRNILWKRFKLYGDARMRCLNIPDEYVRMDPHLIALLRRVLPQIVGASPQETVVEAGDHNATSTVASSGGC